jgi:uncharacterized alpha-E superfamily protein
MKQMQSSLNTLNANGQSQSASHADGDIGPGLISRVADACFWLGRYIERAESTARVLQATLSLALDGELAPRQCWQPAVVVAGEIQRFVDRHGESALEDGELVQRYLVRDAECVASLTRSVGAARENARSIREVLSGDVWQTLNELHLWLGGDDADLEWQAHRDSFYRRVRQGTQLGLGLLRSTMLRDAALDFIWLGVAIERVGQTARMLDVHYHVAHGNRAHTVVETSVWFALLRGCSGDEPFMKKHAGRVSGAAVAAFLFGEPRFPRSIAYCVHSAFERFVAIRPIASTDLPGCESLARLGGLDAWVRRVGAAPDSAEMHAQLTHVVDETAAICDTLGRELFGYGTSAEVPGNVES